MIIAVELIISENVSMKKFTSFHLIIFMLFFKTIFDDDIFELLHKRVSYLSANKKVVLFRLCSKYKILHFLDLFGFMLVIHLKYITSSILAS